MSFLKYFFLCFFFASPLSPQNTFSYYRRFTGNSFPDYDYSNPSYDLCESSTTDCVTSLKMYNGWVSNATDYVISSALIDRSDVQQVYGSSYFGRWDIISKTFNNISTHTTVSVQVSVKSIGWAGEPLVLSVDSYTQTLAFTGTIFKDFTVSIPHTASTLTIKLQSSLNDPISTKSYGIYNFIVTLGNSCPASCIFCSAGLCTKCPFFSSKNPSTSLCQCMDGFFMNSLTCMRCDISCLTCSGPSSNECLTCFSGDTFNTSTKACDSPASDIFFN